MSAPAALRVAILFKTRDIRFGGKGLPPSHSIHLKSQPGKTRAPTIQSLAA